MSTSNQTPFVHALPQSSSLLPVQLAAMEAARAVWEILGEDHRENFVVIGGAALLFHGANIRTEDADIAVTADSYNKFINLAKHDNRFVETVLGPWESTSSYDFVVKIDFLNKKGDGDYIHELKGYTLINDIPVATPIDLAIGKGSAWVERKAPKDFTGLKYAVTIMAQRGLDFKYLSEHAAERLDDIMVELRESGSGPQLLQLIRRLL